MALQTLGPPTPIIFKVREQVARQFKIFLALTTEGLVDLKKSRLSVG